MLTAQKSSHSTACTERSLPATLASNTDVVEIVRVFTVRQSCQISVNSQDFSGLIVEVLDVTLHQGSQTFLTQPDPVPAALSSSRM